MLWAFSVHVPNSTTCFLNRGVADLSIAWLDSGAILTALNDVVGCFGKTGQFEYASQAVGKGKTWHWSLALKSGWKEAGKNAQARQKISEDGEALIRAEKEVYPVANSHCIRTVTVPKW
jgi:hypothetical protein